MPTYRILLSLFMTHLTQYIQENGDQTILQIKQLAKQYAIHSRNGVYDITARKRYYMIYTNYWLNTNNTFPPEWDTMTHSIYDPDDEFPNDPNILRLKGKEQGQLRQVLYDVIDNQ
jgi:hypothetical protein